MTPDELSRSIEQVGKSYLDRAISSFSPKWGASRINAQVKTHLFRYEAARISRLRSSQPRNQPDPESSGSARDRRTLAIEAQGLCENFGPFAGILKKYAKYVAGRLRYQASTGNPEQNKIIDDYVAEWSANCDITGRHDLRTLCQLAVQAEKRDGDIGFVDRINGDSYKIQAIEYDRIGDPNVNIPSDNYRSGIHIDTDTGEPIAYDIFRRSVQTSAYSFDRQVQAEHFHHYFSPLRTDEYRGVTAFASVINVAKDIKEVMEAAITRIKYAASIGALIETANGSANDLGSYFSPSATGSKTGEEQTSFGMLKYLSKGESAKEFATKFPEEMIQRFLEMLIRKIAVALDLPYGFVWDLSSLKGPGSRFEAAMAQRTFEQDQLNLCSRFLNPVKNRAILHGVTSGKLRADFMDSATYRGRWFFAPELTIDFGRDSRAIVDLHKEGLLSEKSIFGENAEDYREEKEQIYREKSENRALAERYGLTYIDPASVTSAGQVVPADGTKESEGAKPSTIEPTEPEQQEARRT